MNSSWQTETGRITCRWSAWQSRDPYTPAWMEHAPNIEGCYLPPLPDFPSHVTL